MRSRWCRSPVLLLVVVFLLWPLCLIGASEDRQYCYTVQVVSLSSSDAAVAFIAQRGLENRCTMIPVGTEYTVRCLPSGTYAAAKQHLAALQPAYANAYVNVTRWPADAEGSGPRCQRDAGENLVDGAPQTGGLVVFPDTFVGPMPEPDQTVASLRTRTDGVRQRYLNDLKDSRPFKGIYVRGNLEEDSEGENRDAIALEWEFFDEGWFEANRDLEKAKVESQVQFYQMLRNMREHDLNEALFDIGGLRNSTRLYVARTRRELLSRLVSKYRKRLQEGYATQEELEQFELRYLRADQELPYYARADLRQLTPEQLDLLNTIEHVSLPANQTLVEHATANSYDIELQGLFARRSEFYPTWVDNLSVRLYVENEKGFRSDERRNTVGMRVRVPIDFGSNRRSLVDLEQSAYQAQREAITLRLAQRVERLSESFRLYQQRIALGTREYHMLRRKQRRARQRLRYPIPSLPDVPDKVLDQLSLELLAKEQEILLDRLTAYEMLVQLVSLVMVDDPKHLVTGWEALD